MLWHVLRLDLLDCRVLDHASQLCCKIDSKSPAHILEHHLWNSLVNKSILAFIPHYGSILCKSWQSKWVVSDRQQLPVSLCRWDLTEGKLGRVRFYSGLGKDRDMGYNHHFVWASIKNEYNNGCGVLQLIATFLRCEPAKAVFCSVLCQIPNFNGVQEPIWCMNHVLKPWNGYMKTISTFGQGTCFLKQASVIM